MILNINIKYVYLIKNAYILSILNFSINVDYTEIIIYNYFEKEAINMNLSNNYKNIDEKELVKIDGGKSKKKDGLSLIDILNGIKNHFA